MIGQVLNSIADDINAHLQRMHFDTLERVLLSNLVDQDGKAPLETENKIVLSLVAMDEEKNVLDGRSSGRGTGPIVNTTDPIFLNLHVVFAATHQHYRTGLEVLAAVITYLKAKPSFDRQNTPQLPGSVRQLNFNLEKLGYAELNSIWSYLGAKYLPSVNYTVRMISLDPQRIQSVAQGLKTAEVAS